jgi:hypothetical protein
MPPIKLSDEAMSAVLAAVRPLEPADRGTFLKLLAQELSTQELNGHELGDGGVFRTVRELHPPDLSRANGHGKYD